MAKEREIQWKDHSLLPVTHFLDVTKLLSIHDEHEGLIVKNRSFTISPLEISEPMMNYDSAIDLYAKNSRFAFDLLDIQWLCSELGFIVNREALDQEQPLVDRYHNNIHFMKERTQLIRDLISRIPTSLHSQLAMVGAFAAGSSHVDYGIQNQIDELCRHYQSWSALHYYINNDFFYQTLNEALRQKREEVFYKYRHATMDIMRCLRRPLPSEENSVALTLYRGQLMTVVEVAKLKANVGELVAWSSFASTTFNRELAEVFSGNGLNGSPYLVSVIFKIHLDTGQPMRSYAHIPTSAEDEVLFSPGTKFLLMSCRKLHHNGRLWQFELRAIPEKQQEQLTLTYGETLMLLTSANGWPNIGRGCSY